MAGATLNSPAQRIGRLKGEILAHAAPTEVLGSGVSQKRMPRQGGETIVYRRYLPYGGATTNANTINRWSVDFLAHTLQEGVTPNADSLTPQDVTVTMQQYGVLYSFTDKTVDLSEDGGDIPDEMKKQTGERIGLLREMIRWGVLKGCSNRFYAGGTSRATVDEKVTLPTLRKITRTLKANHSKMRTSILAPSANFGTKAIEAAYIVYAHTDAENDIRDLPGFTPVADYGQRKPISPEEIGSVESFRFLLSPELAAITDAGATASGTGLETSGTNVDIYPFIVMGEDAAFDVALRGKEAVDPTWLPPGNKDKNDPLGQRGYIGGKFYAAAFIGNDGWMAVLEAGVTDL